MTLTGAFLRLIRWPNLFFIALTQFLFYYCVYLPVYQAPPDFPRLTWLIIASVFIAAAGYIINDYFDLNIDQVNKPDKNVVDRVIHRRWAIAWHFLLSLLGVVATVPAVGFSRWYLVLANLFCVALLWFYSTSFKRQLLIGNIVISLLTAWTTLIVFFAFAGPGDAYQASGQMSVKFFRLAFLYGGFSFIISLVREAVKDMEDLEGDARYGCKTLPVVAGVRATKIYTAVWLIVLVAVLIILQLYILQFGWLGAVVYSVLLVIIPLLLVLLRLSKASIRKDFSYLSGLTKLVMLSGILSMIFFRFYFD
jgi:4-hydroxybenzoate polyprenyltransferase